MDAVNIISAVRTGIRIPLQHRLKAAAQSRYLCRADASFDLMPHLLYFLRRRYYTTIQELLQSEPAIIRPAAP